MEVLSNLYNLLLYRYMRLCQKFLTRSGSGQQLSMSHCQVQVIGSALKRCATIEELRLAHNQLSVCCARPSFALCQQDRGLWSVWTFPEYVAIQGSSS